MIRRLAMLLGVIGLAVGCEQRPTQLLVFVDTDFPEGDLDAFGLRVVGPDEEVHDRGSFSLAGDEPVVLPASFGVAPSGGDADRRVLLEVDAIDQGTVLFTTRARSAFVAGEVMRLDVFLARRCRHEAQDCPAGQSCGPDGCVPIDVPIDDLRAPTEEPDPPQPSIDWTIWSEGGAWGSLDTDDTGVAFVGLNVRRGSTVEIEGVVADLGPVTDAVVARVKPDGTSPWMAELRSPSGAVEVAGVVAGDGVVWVVGAAVDGFVMERGGDRLFEHPGPAPLFVLRMTPDGDVEASATATTDDPIPIYGLTLAENGDLAIGSSVQLAGSLLDASWPDAPAGQGLLLRVASALDEAEACLWPESPSAVYGLAPSGAAVATAGAAGGAPIARGLEAGCAIPWEALPGSLGAHLSVARAPGLPVSLLTGTSSGEVLLTQVDPSGGPVAPEMRFVFDSVGYGLHMETDLAGRLLVSGSTNGRMEYDGLVSDLEVPGRFAGSLVGVGPGLEGRWIRLLESDEGSSVYGTALDPATGAVLFVGSATGTVRFDGEELGVRDGQALLVHRFVP